MNKHIGSSFEDWLDSEGIKQEVTAKAIKNLTDLNQINIANHEFTGEELGALLLESVRQAKAGQGITRQP